MFTDPNTLVILLTSFLSSYLSYCHIWSYTELNQSLCYTFISISCTIQEEDVVGSFLCIFAASIFTCSLQTCITLTKIVYKAKSSEILGCGRLQLGREGIRELHRVVSCNSLPLSCGSVLILVATY